MQDLRVSTLKQQLEGPHAFENHKIKTVTIKTRDTLIKTSACTYIFPSHNIFSKKGGEIYFTALEQNCKVLDRRVVKKLSVVRIILFPVNCPNGRPGLAR